MRNDPIKISYSAESFEMQSALISGRVNDYLGTPTSVYCGPLDTDEIHTALYYVNRAVIKLLKDEFEIPLENCDDFLLSAISEALTKEWNVENSGSEDIDVRKVVKYRKNQN